MSTIFVWTGKGGPNWNSMLGTITDWQIPGGANTIVPSSGITLEAVAAFNDGGIDHVSIEKDTTVTLTGTRNEARASDLTNSADFPDDLVVNDGSRHIIGCGAGMQGVCCCS